MLSSLSSARLIPRSLPQADGCGGTVTAGAPGVPRDGRRIATRKKELATTAGAPAGRDSVTVRHVIPPPLAAAVVVVVVMTDMAKAVVSRGPSKSQRLADCLEF